MPGTWTTLPQITFNAGTTLLLTDGTVLCQELDAQGFGTRNWHKLTPDILGSFENGSWSSIAPLPDNPIIPLAVGGPTNAPLYFASGLLRNGRLIVAGGEYNLNHPSADILAAQIYDPMANSWTVIAPPTGWAKIGDAPSCVLPDGRFLLGSIDDTKTAVYDPWANTWRPGGNKRNISSEETWSLLPDETVLAANCFGHPQTEKYVDSSNTWVTAGSTAGFDLVDDATHEIGPALLLPDGRVFAIGATGNTALYTPPPLPNQPGAWAPGPPFPQINGKTLGATDGPACLLPNGRVLCVVGPVSSNCPANQGYCPPTYFFEFDPIAGTLTQVADPANNPPLPGNPTFVGRMLLLPTGEVLFANNSNSICLYDPGDVPDPAWKPVITSCPTSLQPGQTYTLQGRQLNGLSQACSYGDDAQMATNYPLLRIQNQSNNHVIYCRTANHSTMGVATGAAIHSTEFTVPAGAEVGAYELSVVANCIPSDHFQVTIGNLAQGGCMGMARLNVWVSATDDPCGFDNRTWFINIYDCHGKILEWCGKTFGVLKAPCGHLDVEVPPGCYRINAVWSFRAAGEAYYGNHFTDNAVVCACCDEHVCVKLFNPSIHRCGIIFSHAIQDLLAQKLIAPALGERTQAAIKDLLATVEERNKHLPAFDLDNLDQIEKLVREQPVK